MHGIRLLPAVPYGGVPGASSPTTSSPAAIRRAAWPRHGSWLLRLVPAAALLVVWLVGPLVPDREARTYVASAPVHFSLLDWETRNVAGRFDRLAESLARDERVRAGDAETARAYLLQPPRERAVGRAEAEPAIERLVATAYQDAGVRAAWPAFGDRLFPPVLVALGPPPSVLVVSPRTEIRVEQSILLDPGLSIPEQEAIERSADSTGISSLATSIGGIATYPSMVPDNQSARDLLVTVAHEWLHQYLFFFPLGADYFARQETREINETTADLVGTEIGERVLAELGLPAPPQPGPAQPGGFDFRAFMRATRLEVDRLLAEGRVDEAERFLEARRVELVQHGYVIRKLNQAYFAFNGSYGESPAASAASPVPGLLRDLRRRNPSLADFLARVRNVTTVDQLRAAVQAGP